MTRAPAPETKTQGLLFIVAAPSGGGKSSLVAAVLGDDSRLSLSVSYTTRAPRAGEKHGREYFFVDHAEFGRMRDEGAFLESAEVHGNLYGTSQRQIETLRAAGRDVVLEIDWQGAQQVRERARDAQTIFVLPPNAAELERRLRGRGTDAEATIQRRLRDSLGDMTHWSEFDHLIVNDDFEAALGRLAAVVAGRDTSHRTDAPAVRAAAEAILATGAAA